MTQPDILGAPYTAETIDLGRDAEGPIVATLIHRPADAGGADAAPQLPASAQGKGGAAQPAVLYLHGFVDYFFQKDLGDWWAARGHDFYALDLRKYGRSLLPGQTPFYTENLDDYFEDLTAAWKLITGRDGHRQVILMAHSTGGLIASLWASRTAPPELAAVVLNSPWLDHFNNPLERTLMTGSVAALARFKPRAIVQKEQEDAYARSLHAEHAGIWQFNTAWKTLNFPPVYAGWLAAVRRAHRQLQRGLDIQAPVLLLTSARSGKLKNPTDRHDFDAVLNVQGIRRWGLGLGRDVTSRVIDGGTHDLVLSPEPARTATYRAIGEFIDRL
ncbi:alpha/beta hydrolase [Rothia nasimurium]|uniref:alpha/beta hydrolase n=1 Tax=Rothia nasimurium TaxID=85336 RepID=UPI001F272F28|nr:alpha/beta hydrolase [Rothia nasimurium]